MLSVLTTDNSKNNKEGRRKLWEVIGMVMALVMVVVSWMYTYPQTYRVVCIK